MLLWVLFVVSCSGLRAPDCNGTRPAPRDRLFNSTAVEQVISSFKPRFKDPVLGQLFENTLPNCLDSTVVRASLDDSFIITGVVCELLT